MTKQNIDSNVILQAVDIVINKRIQDLDLDKTIIATIDQPLTPARDGSHRVKYAGGYFTAYAPIGTVYAAHSTVYIQIPQNDFSKRKIILGLASSYNSETDIEVVSSMLNNYTIIGKNTISLLNEEYKETGYGLNSYAPVSNNDFQETILLYDRSNENSQYNINLTDLTTYIKQAKAIMLRADFRTTLLDDQQKMAGAEYGLNFDIVFKNQDSIYKTQGELFAAVASNTIAEINNDGEIETVSMQDYQDDIDSAFYHMSDIELLQNELQRLLPYIESFIDLNKDNFTKQEANIFEAFKYKIIELSTNTTSTLEELREEYENWFAAELGLTEEDKLQTKTLTYSLNSSNMTGNPFTFADFNTQYAILPIDPENFDHIERIYFYEKGFNSDNTRYTWVDKNRYKMPVTVNGVTEWHGKDIWMRDLEIFALQEISSEYGDYKFRIDTPQGSIFKKKDEQLTAKANIVYREYNSVTDDCTFYWFVKDSRVTSSINDYYEMHGGIGWKYLGSTQQGKTPILTINEADNKAYENNYLCAAVYTGAAEGTIVLKQYFTIYNETCKRNISISSTLGVKFKFDSGTPTLTCLIDGKDELFEIASDVLRNDSAFRFVWTCKKSSGQTFYFNRTYDEVKADRDATVDYNARLTLETEMKNLKDVEYPKGVRGNQLVYPIRYLASDGQATFTCQVYTTDNLNNGEPATDFGTDWYSIGDAEIVLSNEGAALIKEYSIVIENGDQVFQYSESGVAPTFASGVTPTDFRHTDPQEIKSLSAHFFDPNGIEVSEGLYSVQWKYPIEDTLIVSAQDLEIDPVTNLADLVVGQSTKFGIADSFDYNALNNQIQCIVSYGGQTYTQDTHFLFTKIGDNGTNGTDIVSKIVVANDDANVTSKYPLTAYIYNNEVTWNIGRIPELELKLYNRSEYVEKDYINIKWDVLGGVNRSNYITLTPLENNRVKLQLDLNKNNYYNNQIIQCSAQLEHNGQVYYCNFPIIIGWYEGDRSEFIKQFESNRISVDNLTYLKQILYNADGRNPLYNKNQGIKLTNVEQRFIEWRVPETLNTDNTYFGLLEEKNSINSKQTFNGYGQDMVYILPNEKYDGSACDNRVEVDVYVSAADQVKLDNYYTQKQEKDSAYNEQVSIIKESIRQEKVRHARVVNSLEYNYKQQQNEILVATDKTQEEKQQAINNITNQYEQNKNDEDALYDNTLDNYNSELNSLQNIYNQEIVILNESIGYEAGKKITFSIPIYMALNTFGLASLNAWDGNHVDINEEGGYIVAPQIGAGKKEEDNTFTGIVMGEMSTYDSEESDVGLLGLSKGRQSIFLDAETGNAIFGLPEEDKFGSSGTDEYYEGRIELKPGDVSRIGGWHLGRRSIFYATDNNDIVQTKLAKAYNDKNSTYEHDINHQHKGILLTAAPNPYISIKGRPLTVGNDSSYDINNSSGNAALTDGDSLELQLDPNMASFFTIYRHYQNSSEWTREKLVGIDAMGRFYTNALQDKETSLNMNYVPGFGQPTTNKKYVGLFVGYGSDALIKGFVQTEKVGNESYTYSSSSPLYISGGSGSDEANRPINLIGKTISLYSGSINNTNRNSTSKITISSSQGYIGNTNAYLGLETGSSATTTLYSVRPIKMQSSNGVTLQGSTLTESFSSNGSSSFSGTYNLTANNNIKLSRTNGHRLELNNGNSYIGSSGDNYLNIQNNGSENSFVSKGNLTLNALSNGGEVGTLKMYSHSNAASLWQAQNSENANGTYINIMALSGAASAAMYERAYDGNLNAAKGNHEVNIYTGRSGYYIRSDFGIRKSFDDGYSVQSTGGWAIKPGIQTDWLYTTGNIDCGWDLNVGHEISGYNIFLTALGELGHQTNLSSEIHTMWSNMSSLSSGISSLWDETSSLWDSVNNKASADHGHGVEIESWRLINTIYVKVTVGDNSSTTSFSIQDFG